MGNERGETGAKAGRGVPGEEETETGQTQWVWARGEGDVDADVKLPSSRGPVPRKTTPKSLFLPLG